VLSAPVLDYGVPFVALWVDALETRPAAAGPAVVAVLGLGADPQVDPAVVQTVLILVVHDEAFGRVHDPAVHQDRPALLGPAGVELASHLHRAPFELAQPEEVRQVHEGDFVAGQRDQLGPVVGRLVRFRPGRGVGLRLEPGTGVVAGNQGGLAQRLGPADADEGAGLGVVGRQGEHAVAATSLFHRATSEDRGS